MNEINLVIDGKKVKAFEGQTILEAARNAGIKIPTLCAFEHLKPYGSCRLCIVEIEGKKGFSASCTTLAQDGMVVYTQSEKINKIRRNILELYLSEHNFDCTTCPNNLRCELQEAASLVGIRDVRFNTKAHIKSYKDSSNPYFEFDSSKCIMCARCVRACDEIQGNFALTILSRGYDSHIKPGINDFINSECVSCGACVKACPTGALIEKNVVQNGSGYNFTKTTCGFCGVGCHVIVESKANTIVNIVGDDKGPNEGHLCVKGRFAWEFVNSSERIKKPLIREKITDDFKETTLEEALDFVAWKFKNIKEKYSKYALAALASSRCTNEEVFLVQKLARCAFENNNIDNCARVCHMPTGFALGLAFGTGAGTADIESLKKAECIMVVGSNTTHAHPVVGSLIRQLAISGKKLIVIDPRGIDLAKQPHIKALHLQPYPGTNVALLNSIAHVIVKENLYDKDFIENKCDIDSFKLWLDFISSDEYNPTNVSKIAGVDSHLIEKAAREFATSKKATIVYGLGVTEHTFGSSGVFCLTNLAMLCGFIGKEGCGVSPLRGQNNVQGASDMGAFPNVFTFYRHISDEQTRKTFESVWKKTLDTNVGFTIPQMFKAAIDGRLKGMYIVGEDVFQTDPNTYHIKEALSSLEFLVVQELFLSPTTQFAHVVLPGSSYLEKNGTFTNWERRVSKVNKVIEPLSGIDEYKIITELSKKLGYPMDYNSEEEIFNEIALLSPQFSTLTYEKLQNYGSLLWPVDSKNQTGTRILHTDEFLNKKGKFFITNYVANQLPNDTYPFILTTGRNLFHYNSSNQTRKTKNVAFYDADYLEINEKDAVKLNISNNDLVEVKSESAKITLKAKVTDKIKPGVLFTTFHFTDPKTNALLSQNTDWATDTPEYKFMLVNIKKADKETYEINQTKNPGILEQYIKIFKFFEKYPQETRTQLIANHIKKNWDTDKINTLKTIEPIDYQLKQVIERV
ncbi:formate dehydrogenase subunit alpha [Desulfurella multipotens]|uniref:formate dehydrogenase subunit alpha n=1 Tax=Desulfurella multipotens TaxID=79269 RepID=UPI000CC8EF62|nr:formate dehydrogenase subunit alpha [Desulfurella multipotens]PMP64593.1 MAG: formate dehydrogenase subunit alpha [Desulfurella multipotens]